MVGDVGIGYDTLRSNNLEWLGGTLPQSVRSCMASLDQILGQQSHAVFACFVLAEAARAKYGKASSSASLRDVVARILGNYGDRSFVCSCFSVT